MPSVKGLRGNLSVSSARSHDAGRLEATSTPPRPVSAVRRVRVVRAIVIPPVHRACHSNHDGIWTAPRYTPHSSQGTKREPSMTTGACLCGAVRYEISGPYKWMTHCHCSMCRKHHGSLYGTTVGVDPKNFRWIAGEEAITVYRSSDVF